MKLTIFIFFLALLDARGIPPLVPKSISPDGKLYAVMDIDRDPSISPEWKGKSFPKIEITQKNTGKILASIAYFGSPSDDARLLRERVQVRWKPDSNAFAITIVDRFYSNCLVFALSQKQQFVEVSFPSYKVMTGFPSPSVKHLRPRARSVVEGWDQKGWLVYSLSFYPLPSFSGSDPLKHRVYLDVSARGMVVKKVDSAVGEWKEGVWMPQAVK